MTLLLLVATGLVGSDVNRPPDSILKVIIGPGVDDMDKTSNCIGEITPAENIAGFGTVITVPTL